MSTVTTYSRALSVLREVQTLLETNLKSIDLEKLRADTSRYSNDKDLSKSSGDVKQRWALLLETLAPSLTLLSTEFDASTEYLRGKKSTARFTITFMVIVLEVLVVLIIFTGLQTLSQKGSDIFSKLIFVEMTMVFLFSIIAVFDVLVMNLKNQSYQFETELSSPISTTIQFYIKELSNVAIVKYASAKTTGVGLDKLLQSAHEDSTERKTKFGGACGNDESSKSKCSWMIDICTSESDAPPIHDVVGKQCPSKLVAMAETLMALKGEYGYERTILVRCVDQGVNGLIGFTDRRYDKGNDMTMAGVTIEEIDRIVRDEMVPLLDLSVVELRHFEASPAFGDKEAYVKAMGKYAYSISVAENKGSAWRLCVDDDRCRYAVFVPGANGSGFIARMATYAGFNELFEYKSSADNKNIAYGNVLLRKTNEDVLVAGHTEPSVWETDSVELIPGLGAADCMAEQECRIIHDNYVWRDLSRSSETNDDFVAFFGKYDGGATKVSYKTSAATIYHVEAVATDGLSHTIHSMSHIIASDIASTVQKYDFVIDIKQHRGAIHKLLKGRYDGKAYDRYLHKVVNGIVTKASDLCTRSKTSYTTQFIHPDRLVEKVRGMNDGEWRAFMRALEYTNRCAKQHSILYPHRHSKVGIDVRGALKVYALFIMGFILLFVYTAIYRLVSGKDMTNMTDCFFWLVLTTCIMVIIEAIFDYRMDKGIINAEYMQHYVDVNGSGLLSSLSRVIDAMRSLRCSTTSKTSSTTDSSARATAAIHATNSVIKFYKTENFINTANRPTPFPTSDMFLMASVCILVVVVLFALINYIDPLTCMDNIWRLVDLRKMLALGEDINIESLQSTIDCFTSPVLPDRILKLLGGIILIMVTLWFVDSNNSSQNDLPKVIDTNAANLFSI